MPHSIVLNKDREQSCRSTVMDPCAAKTCEYTERLTELAEPFVGQYDFRIRVYQNTDISSLDKKIQDRVCLHQPRLFRELDTFVQVSRVILANRFDEALLPVRDKVYTRDLYQRD